MPVTIPVPTQAPVAVGSAQKLALRKHNLGPKRPRSRGRHTVAKHFKNRREDNYVARNGSFVALGTCWARGSDPYSGMEPSSFLHESDLPLPWFKTLGPAWRTASAAAGLLRDDLIPPLDEATQLVEEDPSRTRAWQSSSLEPRQPQEEDGREVSLSPTEMVESVLQDIGFALYIGARKTWVPRPGFGRRGRGRVLEVLGGSEAIVSPLGGGACLFLDPALTKGSGIRFQSTKYASITLAGRPRPEVELRMGVHRFVCWACLGPPPLEPGLGMDVKNWVAMHSCDNKDCVNRLHIEWGLITDNNTHESPTQPRPVRVARRHV